MFSTIKMVFYFNKGIVINNLMEALINILVYGERDNCYRALELYSIIIKYTEERVMKEYAMKMVGPLIRIVNYKYDEKLKTEILKTLFSFDAEALRPFSPQLLSVYTRLIKEIPTNKQLKLNFANLIRISSRKDNIINDFFQKAKNERNSEIQKGLLSILKYSISRNQDTLSKALLENLFKQISDFQIVEDTISVNSIKLAKLMAKVFFIK